MNTAVSAEGDLNSGLHQSAADGGAPARAGLGAVTGQVSAAVSAFGETLVAGGDLGAAVQAGRAVASGEPG